MKIYASIEIPDQNLLDTLTTAVEGGIRYWIVEEEMSVKTTRNTEGYVTELRIRERGTENKPGKLHVITPTKIAEAWAKVAVGEIKLAPSFIAALMTLPTEECALDAEQADALVQIAAFGEVVFG